MIFVFGSNLAGIHGSGAAKEAHLSWGAKLGKGIGRTGNSYAIPTKDRDLQPLSLEAIQEHIDTFLTYAREHPTTYFCITRIGCGLAGYTDNEIAFRFANAPDNCHVPIQWSGIIASMRQTA